MSTETGHHNVANTLYRLASLIADAIDLIRKGQRPAVMIDALLRALQLFKENALEMVRKRQEPDETQRHERVVESNTFRKDKTDWARAQIKKHEKGRRGHRCGVLCQIAAEIEMGALPTHQCYWNDRFGIALAFKLSTDFQRLAAWCAVSNGLNDYWEWQTHFSYDLAGVLHRLGLKSVSGEERGGYCTLSRQVAAEIADYFDLPTTLVGSKTSLTEDQLAERGRFNSEYPYADVL